MSGEGEVGGGASGQPSARGSACSKEWATAELLDTVEWREVDGGRGYSGEVAAVASAMVGERRRRGDGGEWRCPEARGRVEGFVQRIHGRGRQAGGAVASPRPPASPLCLLWREQAADWRGPAQCWAARWAAR